MLGIRRSTNGRFAANGADDIEAELRAVETAIAATERAGAPLTNRQATLEAEIAEAEKFFHQHGLHPVGVAPQEIAHNFRRALRGAFAILDREAGGVLLEAERNRIAEHFDREGGTGFTDEERRARLAELGQRRRQLLGQLEVQWRRQEEAGGELVADARRAELLLLSDSDLAAVIEGRDPG